MMLDRDRLNFWVRFVAIGLAVVFIGSFVSSSGLVPT